MPSTISGSKIVTDEIENSSGANPYNITLNAEIDTSTGSQSYDVENIPSGVKRITVLLAGVSLSGSEKFMVQLGTGGSPTTSGYLGGADYDSAGGGIN